MGVHFKLRVLLVIMCNTLFGFVTSVPEFRNKRFFQTLTFAGVASRGGRKCHDFCQTKSDRCENGGTCITDQSTCQGGCVCAPEWTGQRCQDLIALPFVQATTDSTVGSGGEADNSAGKFEAPEKHTNVSNSQSNNKTAKSNTPVGNTTTETRLNIANTLTTIFPQLHNVLRTNFQATVSNINHINNQQANVSTESTDRLACNKHCLDGDCVNINDIYKCRTCGPGFHCKHGVCDSEKLKRRIFACICESNYVGGFCQRKCPLNCGDHGVCNLHISKNKFFCFCHWNYTGQNCTEPVILEQDQVIHPEEIIFHWYVVGISVGIVILVVTLLVVASYFMWKKRLVFMLKIVHYFQQYEEDDGKEYDAFVSYKSTAEDEKFVLQKLYPKLELEYKFKLCMHFRDFLPGEAIANNIVKAIESSRRTIMVLSPAYVKSEWCRMEYQKAQHEMLKLKHKIIPIVLEDISEVKSVDQNLKSILNSVTYLEWPGSESSKKVDRFWKKLELSLPKKSFSSTTSLETQSSLESRSLQSELPSQSQSLHISTNSPSPESLTPTSNENSESVPRDNLRVDIHSPTPSSEELISTQVPKNKKKDLKHFMGKLVKSRLFLRQDSSSSQAALVDEDTVASRSSCDSISESMLTESSESCCSTPITTHSYLSEVSEDKDNNVFFTGTSRHTCIKMSDRSKEVQSGICEKDHYEGVECVSCLQIIQDIRDTERRSREFLNRGFVNDNDNDIYCNCGKSSSDDNRVRISATDGVDKVNIQKLDCTLDRCRYCYHAFSRNAKYSGSVKQHKDAANMQLLQQNKNGSLPRNFKGSVVHARSISPEKGTLKTDKYINDNESNTNTTFFIDICENV